MVFEIDDCPVRDGQQFQIFIWMKVNVRVQQVLVWWEIFIVEMIDYFEQLLIVSGCCTQENVMNVK